ncbi:hypothetical protein VNI00_017899 [Paramarasmius palmivorus]|uniref:Uncharacterized protein n=1 Tax=Paramarasmius palmivorus TaxID=297713 RepID=A0AAW0B2C2_9AGAR
MTELNTKEQSILHDLSHLLEQNRHAIDAFIEQVDVTTQRAITAEVKIKELSGQLEALQFRYEMQKKRYEKTIENLRHRIHDIIPNHIPRSTVNLTASAADSYESVFDESTDSESSI